MKTTFLVTANLYYFEIIGPIDITLIDGALLYESEPEMFEAIHKLVSLDVEDMDGSSILLEYNTYWDKWTETNQMGCWEPREVYFEKSIENFISQYAV